MRHLLAPILLLLSLCASAEGRRYAVLSLVGDKLLVVEREMSTGSHMDRNRRQSIPLGSRVLDNTMSFAVEDAVKKAQPDAEVMVLGARSPALFEAQARLLEDGAQTATLIPVLKGALPDLRATHLLLVTKHRHEALLRLYSGHTGSGTLEGLGFYLDPSKRLINRDTGAQSSGFIAPFVYFRVALVDLASGEVLREERVTASTVVGDQAAAAPWGALSAEQKVRIIEGLIRREAASAVPKLLSP